MPELTIVMLLGKHDQADNNFFLHIHRQRVCFTLYMTALFVDAPRIEEKCHVLCKKENCVFPVQMRLLVSSTWEKVAVFDQVGNSLFLCHLTWCILYKMYEELVSPSSEERRRLYR